MQDETFLPYRPLGFSICTASCGGEQCQVDPDLEFTVEEVSGTSETVARGERYIVRGRYELGGTAPFAISIAVFSKAFGATAYLLPGKGRFEASTEILELIDKSPNGLGIVVANEHTGKGNIARWVMLQ